MRCIDKRNKAIKILGIYFSYNQNIKNERKICNIILNCLKFMENNKFYIKRKNDRI